ncbi:cation:proton antiporter, partial [Streptomyces sp. T-3]|nr:cation:proton antiporter [Streptomyces sp. T-3]
GGRFDLAVLVAGGLLAAGASSAAGLHQLIGALLFGFLWGRHRPQDADDLTGRLGPLSGKVLLPCFFLGFGQRLDLRAVDWSGGFLGLLLVLLLIAVVVKSASCALAGALRGLPSEQWLRLGVLMNSRGLTEIVVLSVGYDAGLIDRTLLLALTLVALLTTGMAGPGLRLLDRLRPLGTGREDVPAQMPETLATVNGRSRESKPN